MRILLITAGSRGDVEPFVALARRAMDAGHIVRLVAPDNSGVDEQGVDVRSLGVDYSQMIQSGGVSVRAAMRDFRTVVKPMIRSISVGAAHAATSFRPDVIAYHPKILSAPLVADALGIPHVLVEMVPVITPTRAFPAAGTVTADLGPLNRLTYAAATLAGPMFAREADAAAEVMGVTGRRHDSPPAATLVPISPAILPRPADWPQSVHITGAWAAASSTKSDPAAISDDDDLAAFAEQGPFVYAGFGSMVMGDAVARGRTLVAAARSRGDRMLIVTGLGGIVVPGDIRGDDVLVRSSVNHAAVLPRAEVAIHHGGAGTVHAALRAATMSVVVPFIADQPFWGALLHRRGLGPAPIRQSHLTTAGIASAIAEAPTYKERLVRTSELMGAEDGTLVALRVLEALA